MRLCLPWDDSLYSNVQVQKGLIDMENMFQLLSRRSAVQDMRFAQPLTVSQGASGLLHGHKATQLGLF